MSNNSNKYLQTGLLKSRKITHRNSIKIDYPKFPSIEKILNTYDLDAFNSRMNKYHRELNLLSKNSDRKNQIEIALKGIQESMDVLQDLFNIQANCIRKLKER